MKTFFRRSIMIVPLILISLVGARKAFALTYSTDVNVQFTFNPALQIDLSSADLLIPSLSPGTTADSNVIDVVVKTNNVTGYTLNATVGNNTTYNTRNLVHEVSGSSTNFASINYGSSLASLTTDNTWGYSYSTDGGSNWEDYDGLPLYSDATNIATLKNASVPPATNAGDTINFKIAAKASTSQASGDYNNVINFIVVGNAMPIDIEEAFADAGKEKLNGYYKMQDMTPAICDAVNVFEEETMLIDIRDNKTYSISKLLDSNCWMTQNLDHDIMADGTVIYDNTTTDLGWNANTDSYDTADWSPNTTTNTAAAWNYSDDTPESYDPGEIYWNGATGYYYSEVDCIAAGGTWSGTNHCIFVSSTGDPHYHLGNFYNWTAALATNDSSAYTTDNQVVHQSICPSGWTLPLGGNNTSTGSFRYLLERYGWSSNKMTDPYIWNSAIKLPLSGDWNGSLNAVGDSGGFWSSNVADSEGAYLTDPGSSGYVWSSSYYYRYEGRSVRCVAR